MIICSRNNNNRNVGIPLTKSKTEFLDIFTGLIFTMNHNTISTRFNISIGAFQSVTHRFAGNKAFNTSNNHKILSNLRFLTCFYFRTKTLNRILSLNCISTKKRVFFQSYFIFDNNRRNTMAFKRTNCECKMLYLATCIAIKNDRFSSTFKDIIQILQTSCKVNGLNIRFTFTGRISQTAGPHTVKNFTFITFLDFKILNNKSAKTIMRLKNTNNRFSIY